MWPLHWRTHRHLGDERLLARLYAPVEAREETGQTSAAWDAHLDECLTCTERLAEMKTFLHNITKENEQAFEEAFPVERLAAQRARILRRLSKVSEQRRPARILRFPAIAGPALATVHAARRWLGAAAAAGLLLGLSIGQFVHLHPRSELADQSPPPAVVSEDTSSASPAQRPLPVSVDDEAFMDEVELVLSNPQVQELSTLDAITPRIREVAINLW